MNYLTKQLLELSILYARHEGVELETLSRRIFGNSNRLPDMRDEKSNPTTPIWLRGVEYLSDAWPSDLDWPAELEWIRKKIILPSRSANKALPAVVEDA